MTMQDAPPNTRDVPSTDNLWTVWIVTAFEYQPPDPRDVELGRSPGPVYVFNRGIEEALDLGKTELNSDILGPRTLYHEVLHRFGMKHSASYFQPSSKGIMDYDKIFSEPYGKQASVFALTDDQIDLIDSHLTPESD